MHFAIQIHHLQYKQNTIQISDVIFIKQVDFIKGKVNVGKFLFLFLQTPPTNFSEAHP